MHHPTDRITHTTTFVTPVVEHWLEREIAQWVHPMKDRSDDPTHHGRTLLPRSYISLLRAKQCGCQFPSFDKICQKLSSMICDETSGQPWLDTNSTSTRRTHCVVLSTIACSLSRSLALSLALSLSRSLSLSLSDKQ